IHPGLVKTEIGTKDTSKLYAWFWKMFTNLGISPNDAAQTYESLVYEHRKSTDFYFSKSLPSLISKAAQSDENRDLLWYETLDLLKINF
ncbi:MAG: hypothetical protein IH571_01255, partial [Acholeplasmataceae bacterium]|nr:hypothetical protein [Acholeplasmataceae bacterium]